MEEKILEFDVSSATVELAATALHCEPQRIAKTLSFMVDSHAVLVVAAGDAKIYRAFQWKNWKRFLKAWNLNNGITESQWLWKTIGEF